MALLLLGTVMIEIIGDNMTYDCVWGSEGGPSDLCRMYREDGNNTVDGEFIDGVWDIGEVIILAENVDPGDSIYGPDDDGMGIYIHNPSGSADSAYYSVEYLKVD